MVTSILGGYMEKDEALKKLQTLIENIGELQKLNYQDPNPLLDKFISRGERYLTNIFDKDNKYLSNFTSLDYFSPTFVFVTGFDNTASKNQENNQAYHKDLIQAKTIIESAIEEVEEWKDNNTIGTTALTQTPQSLDSNKIFIVHGHDELAISQVCEVLIKLKLEPIILKEEASKSNTIIEKIERLSSEVGFGIVLYTACDIGGKNSDSLQPRARQNVLLEHGFLMAKLGRENTLALKKGNVETPSDVQGLVYTTMDEHKAWQYKLVDELKASGYSVSKDSI